jgi:serine/threonine protein phosphatase 1
MALSPRNRPAPRSPDATRIYAVGDLHGRLDLLEGALDEIAKDATSARRERADTVAVFLGDYIDRGPDSAGVIDALMAFRDASPAQAIFLRGNHEQVLLDLLDGEETTTRWLDYGGRETLASYGVNAFTPTRTLAELRDLVASSIPLAHVQFLRATTLNVIVGDYLFVHAGLRPDRLLEEQSDADLLWFRYYDDATPVWDYTVVHGHSTNPMPVVGRWRLGIDTEAYASGALTVLRLETDKQELLKITAPQGRGSATVEPWRDADVSYRSKPRSAAAAIPEAGARKPRPRAPIDRSSRAGRPSARLALSVVGGLVGVAGATALAIAAIDHQGRSPQPVSDHNAPLPSDRASRADAPRRDTAASQPRDRTAELDINLRDRSAGPVPVGLQAPAAKGADLPEASAVGVQIGAVRTASDVRRVSQDVMQQFPALMVGKTVRVEPVEKAGQTLQRVIVQGFPDLAAAEGFCHELRQGSRACILRKPTRANDVAPAIRPNTVVELTARPSSGDAT